MTERERGTRGSFSGPHYPNARVRVGKGEWVPLLPHLPLCFSELASNSEGR